MDLDDLHSGDDEKGVEPLSVVYSSSENPALHSEAGSGDEADVKPDSVGIQVPLPHKSPPRGAGLAGIADSLARDGVLSDETRLEVRRLVDSGRRLNAAVVLLRDWTVADKLGKRIKDAPVVLSPDPGKYPGLSPSTFRPDILKALFLDEQQEVISYLMNGFVNGFRIVPDDTRFESVSYKNISPPDASAMEALAATTATEASLGRIGLKQPGMDPFIISPIFAVEKKKDGAPKVDESGRKKYRQAHHLSRGNKHHLSVNEMSADISAEIKYETVQDAVNHIFDIAKNVAMSQRAASGGSAQADWVPSIDEIAAAAKHIRMNKFDCEAAFRICPLHESAYPLLGFQDASGRTWYESRLCFGLRIAPRLYSALSNVLSWLLSEILGVRVSICYLDDYLLISIDMEESALAYEVFTLVFALLGIPLTIDKEETHAVVVDFLGVSVNVENMSLTIPEARLRNLERLLDEWASKDRATAREIYGLAGKLSHASRILRNNGRFFMNRLWSAIRAGDWRSAKAPYDVPINLGEEFHKDIAWWRIMLRYINHPSVARMVDVTRVIAHEGVYFTDASTSFGCAGVRFPAFWQLVWDDGLKHMKGFTVATLEAFALPVTVMWEAGPEAHSGKTLLFYCDNQNVCSAWKGQKIKEKVSGVLHYLRVLLLLSVIYNFKIDIQYIETDRNPSDLPSRVRADQVLAQCSQLTSFVPARWLPPLPSDPAWEEQMVTAARLALRARQ